LVFPFSLIALYLGQKFLHKRTILSLHTSAKKIRWSRGLQAFFITWIVLSAFTAIGHFTGLSPVNINFDAGRFAIYALVSLIFIPMQSGTEEIVFRGYLNQGFAHILRNKWIAFIITSALFAAMHLSNPEALKGAEDGILLLTMSSYFFFGFIACIMVWMDDGLESAIGFHAGNNCFAAIFVNYEGSVLPTPSLFMATPNTVIDVPTTLLAMCVIAAILYKTRKPLDMTFA
jgi:membrane protease YdiL (CAAX protease family)